MIKPTDLTPPTSPPQNPTVKNPAAQACLSTVLPVLPLRDSVLFPHLMMPLVVQRPQALAAVLAALDTEDKTLAVVAQKHPEVEDPTWEHLHEIGVIAVIKKMGRVDNSVHIVLQGTARVRLIPADAPHHRPGEFDLGNDSGGTINTDDASQLLWPDDGTDGIDTDLSQSLDATAGRHLTCHVELLPSPTDWPTDTEAVHREVIQLALQILRTVNPQSEVPFQQMLSQMKLPLSQVYLISTLLSLTTDQEQELLASNSLGDTVQRMHEYLTRETQVLKIRQQISSQVQSELSAEQRNYFLRKQLQAI